MTGNTRKEFEEWINEPIENYSCERVDDNHYVLKNDHADAEVNFYESDIVEFRILRHGEEDPAFFLHFQLNDMNHAKELFAEMIAVLKNVSEKKKIRVLLSCSSGLTTSYFKAKLNEADFGIYQQYEFFAADQTRLFELGFDYDVILLAPQISYLYTKARKVFVGRTVLKIPSAIFGSYDVMKALEFVDQAIAKKDAAKPKPSVRLNVKNTMGKILAVSVQAGSDPARIAYRIYDHGRITLDEMVIKQYFRPTDVADILDFVLTTEKDIQIVGVSIPGIIQPQNGNSLSNLFDDHNVISSMSKQYNIPVICENNVNCAALGYFSTMDEEKNIVFHYQNSRRNIAGQGMICNGQLITGYKHAAGEVRYMSDMIRFSGNPDEMMRDLDGAAEVVADYLLMSISMMSPDKIVVCCKMTPDSKPIREKLSKYIPESYIPEIICIPDMKEYMLMGQVLLCSRYLKEII